MRVRTVVRDFGTASRRPATGDLDFLSARLHGRVSRMAAGQRLDSLCRISALPEFLRAVSPETDIQGASDFQSAAVRELIREVSGFPVHVAGAGADLLRWALVRFQLESLKVLMRICVAGTAAADPERYVAFLPPELALDARGLASAESLKDFVERVPRGLFRRALEKAREIHGDDAAPFFPEAELDTCYFAELVERLRALPEEDREIVSPVVFQEVDTFHLMVVLRGRFHYHLTAEALLPFHVTGTRVSRATFAAMAGDGDIPAAAARASGRVLDGAPAGGPQAAADDAAGLERLAWKRFLRLSNLAFRRSHMGLGAIVGYVGLRRVEVANLITISEGIEKGIAAGTIRGRLISLGDGEAVYV